MVLLLTVLMTLLPFWAKDDYRHRNITMNDGLTANAVRNIVQDKYGFMWFGTDNGLCRFDGTTVQVHRIPELGINQYISSLFYGDEVLYVGTEKGVFVVTPGSNTSFNRLPIDIKTTVTSIVKDKEGSLWVSTMGQGVWLYANGKVRHYNFDDTSGMVSQVFVDNSNQVWALSNTDREPVHKLNRLHDRFEPVGLKYDRHYNSLTMLQTNDGRLWLGSWEEGLLLIHSDGRVEQMLSPSQTKLGLHIHTLFERSSDCICIGCDNGIICFNPNTKQYNRLLENEGLSDRFVYSIISDTEGGMWIGTFYGGVTYVSPVSKRFEAYSMDDSTTGLDGNVISRFCEDKHGRIWIASDDGGLMCYDPEEQSFIDYPHKDILSHQNTHALSFCGDELWIGTYTSGVLVLNIETGKLDQYTQTRYSHSLDNSSSYAIYTDKRGHVWVATMEGLNLFNHQKKEFDRIGKVNSMIIDIDEDRKGNLWLSTQGGGLWKYNIAHKEFKQYLHNDKDKHSLPDNQVNCSIVDENGHLWIGTFSGLCRYENDRFERITLDVPSNNIMGIIEDKGALWLSTERGIVKYDPKQLQRFTLHDGLVSEQFQPNSGLKASDGRIYFGSTSGFNAFYPYQIKANSVMPPVYITSMSILNHEEHTAEGLPLDLSQTKEITIGYGDNRMVSFTFASLSYCSPEKNQYAYKLEGFDNDWNYVGNQNRATYTNIPAGTYTFRVKATNNDGFWSTNEATLRIVVHPPFWWSWYAKIIYLLLIGAAVWWYVQYRLRRAEHRHQKELQELNEEKEKEVREARLNFFTMIAHEIRTPVSLIIGPLEKIMKRGNPSEDMKVIDRNAHRLLELVNQLLDFRKVEQQSLVMHFSPQNIHELIQSISERFAPTFEQGGKHFTVEYPDEHFSAMIDKEGVTKIISNLLTNANKYTKDDVRLSCQTDPDGKRFRITVTDNGTGIREEDRLRIFQPFFQAMDNKPGTGIGLNIVKNIVEQHHGTIHVDSEVGKGSTFTIVLPVKQAHVENRNEEVELVPTRDAQENLNASNVINTQASTFNSTLSRLLIVDDSEDMVAFLSSSFSDQYDVITAGDGIEALNLLNKYEVSIIISDWMMPRMDGAELCRRVRQNPLTSHIPFVMLTAKTDDDSKVEGMDVGADTYIEKPFSVLYLEACIRNILQMRRHLIEKFSTQPLEPVTEIAQNPTDNEFLKKMNRIIEENFSNSELNVNYLADKLNISRSGLFAKIKLLADITPNEMIQIVRLKRAAQLLRESDRTVSEISYLVGFTNPSYFSKCFQKQFGIRPLDMRNGQPTVAS